MDYVLYYADDATEINLRGLCYVFYIYYYNDATEINPRVIREPIVRDADPVRGLPALVADLGVRGLWVAQYRLHETLLDIRVMDTY
mgnify:FL=1